MSDARLVEIIIQETHGIKYPRPEAIAAAISAEYIHKDIVARDYVHKDKLMVNPEFTNAEK